MTYKQGQNCNETKAFNRVYAIQCKTWAIAKMLTGKQSNVIRVDMSAPMPTDGLFRFRCLPAYRSPDALALRKRVADIVRANR